jgi:putative ABC transport system permease protein
LFENYLKVAWRNIIRHKGYSFINVFGLAVGLTCCMLIFLYVRQELSFDTFHRRADRIYRFTLESSEPEGKTVDAPTPSPAAPILKSEFPEIQKITRIYFAGSKLMASGQKRFYEKGVIFADADFFDIFTFPVLKGASRNLLANPNSLVLTATAAKRYFGDQDPLGRTFRLENKYDFSVTGVVADVPANSHFSFDFIAAYPGLNDDIVGLSLEQWGANLVFTYALFPEHFDGKAFAGKVAPFIEAHARKTPGRSLRLLLQPLKGIHLHSHMSNEIEPGNSVSYLVILASIGLFILLLAAINFVNLTTARSTQRFREVGMRKINGASGFQLLTQYLGESITMTYLALALALLLTVLLLPAFSHMINSSVGFRIDIQAALFLLVIIPLLVGFLAGIYPAFYLARQLPATTLKGKTALRTGKRAAFQFRQVLVVAQFVISIALMVATLTVKGQLRFMVNADLGFKKDRTLIIPVEDRALCKRIRVMKDELRRIPGVQSVTSSLGVPIGNSFGSNVYPDGIAAGKMFSAGFKFVDTDYLDHFGMKLISGRSFSADRPSDEWESFIVNQELLKKLGYAQPDQAIGRKIEIGLNNVKGTIIGVIQDFHNTSLQNPIDPQVLIYCPTICSEVSVRLAAGRIESTLSQIQASWQNFSPDRPFTYTFLDEEINRHYEAEQRILKIVGIFSFLAILIACLGLFGLAAFSAQRRCKEIGIRKVLGATTREVILLMSREFFLWIGLAICIAWPAAYFAMNRWLQGFAYRSGIGVGLMLLSGLLAVGITMATVSYQSIKAATANPVDSLRYE